MTQSAFAPVMVACYFCSTSAQRHITWSAPVLSRLKSFFLSMLLSRHVFLRFQLASGHAHTTPASNVSKQLKSAEIVYSGN
jgi:hypothetical protein